MNKTKRLTLAAVASALAVTVLYIGSLVEVLDLTAIYAASLCVAFCVVELGNPWQWLVYLTSSVLAVLLVPNKFAALEYALVVGHLPIFKLYFEKLWKPLAFFLKFLTFNLLYTGVLLLTLFVFDVPMEGELFGVELAEEVALVILYAMGNLAFLLYDYLLTKLAILYHLKYRSRVQNWLNR